MRNYLTLLNKVINYGDWRTTRTEVGAFSLFGEQLGFDLRDGFPLVTTKRVHIPSVVHELLWFIRGETNVKSLQANKVRIWNEWADQDGDLGPIYGAQWRRWQGNDGKVIDQLARVEEEIKNNPSSRRLLVSAWNVGELDNMALPPCHVLFQFFVNMRDNTLSCHVYQRSADIFLGVPFNIASYALLTEMMARSTGLGPGKLTFSFGDVHLYMNHTKQAEEQLQRTPKELPRLRLTPAESAKIGITDWSYDDIIIEGYDPCPAIKAPVAV